MGRHRFRWLTVLVLAAVAAVSACGPAQPGPGPAGDRQRQRQLAHPAEAVVLAHRRDVQAAHRGQPGLRHVLVDRRRADPDADLGDLQPGPGRVRDRTTFTPTAFSTGAFTTLTDQDWAKVGGKAAVPARDARPVRPGAARSRCRRRACRMCWCTTRSCSPRPGSTTRPTPGTACWRRPGSSPRAASTAWTWPTATRRHLETRPQHDPPAGNPLVQGKTVTLDDPRTVAAYRTLYSLRSAGVADPATVGWNNSRRWRRSPPARRR